jgi:hypothetical protein
LSKAEADRVATILYFAHNINNLNEIDFRHLVTRANMRKYLGYPIPDEKPPLKRQSKKLLQRKSTQAKKSKVDNTRVEKVKTEKAKTEKHKAEKSKAVKGELRRPRSKLRKGKLRGLRSKLRKQRNQVKPLLLRLWQLTFLLQPQGLLPIFGANRI